MHNVQTAHDQEEIHVVALNLMSTFLKCKTFLPKKSLKRSLSILLHTYTVPWLGEFKITKTVQEGQTALHQAAQAGHHDTVAALVLGGCDVGIQDFVSLYYYQ